MDPGRAAELLAAERARVEEQLRRLGAEFEPGAPESLAEDSDYGDRAADLVDRRAEARLAEGTYGLSIVSGEPISDARLERFPTAERTADEQRLFERGQL
jgi:DnaK suppressor protein